MRAEFDVSIVIPTYNRLPYLRHCLESCLSQAGDLRIEVIVVDDGSTDGTCDWVRERDGRIVYVAQENAGQGAARNKGMSVARGEYAMFLDSDDLLAPHAVARMVTLARQAGADIVVGGWTSFCGAVPTEGPIVIPGNHRARSDRAKVVATLPVVSAYVFRHRDVPWRERMTTNEGVDWILRYIAYHPHVVCLDDSVTYIRQHEAPTRISVAHDHFDPAERAAVFAAVRPAFSCRKPADVECLQYLDLHICREVIGALRRYGELPTFNGINSRMRPKVVAGRHQGAAHLLLVRALGLRWGTRVYHALHRITGRTP